MEIFIQGLKLCNALTEESYTPQEVMDLISDNNKPSVVFVVLMKLTKQQKLRYDVGDGFYTINEALDEFTDLAFAHLKKIEEDIPISKLPY